MNIIRKIQSVAIGGAFALAVAFALPGPAFAGTLTGGATEPTQILNHIELILQYEKQLQQAETQLHSYIALAQQLKSLPGSVAGQIQGVKNEATSFNANNLGAAQQMLTTLQSLDSNANIMANESQHAYDTIQYMQAQGHNVTAQQYMMGMALLSQQHADTYGKRYQAYLQAVQQSQTDMQTMTQLDAQAPGIASDVGGLQAVVHTNAVLGQQLVGIKQVLLTDAAQRTERDQQEAQRAANKHTADSQAVTNYAAWISASEPGSVPANQ